MSLITFLITTIGKKTKLKIITDHNHTITTLHKIINTEAYNLHLLNKGEYPSLFRIFKGLTLDHNIALELNKEIKLDHPQKIFFVDITPQHFTYNNYTLELFGFPITSQIKTIIKQTKKITNVLQWFNQQKINLWHSYLGNVQWDLTLNALSFQDKPSALYTHLLALNLKNFKVKLISEELLTFLLLHFCDQRKYKNYLCPCCYAEPEDIAHLLICVANHINWTTEICKILTRISNEIETPLYCPENFMQSFKNLHINKKAHLGIITNFTLLPVSSPYQQKKYTPYLHHLIIEMIYKTIWLPSRTSRHSKVMPIPQQLETPTLRPTIPLTPQYLKNKTIKYITYRQTSLQNLTTD